MDILALIGGLALFLFGMNIMSSALEKLAGGKLKTILASMTSNVFKGFTLGLGITAIIQSSSATTVMVVGFVNSGLMTLKQATGVILGANLGTSVTSWLLSTTGIGDSAGAILQLLKPSSFTPVLAFIGMLLYCFLKSQKKKNIGLILLGFSVLMYGMEFMTAAVETLSDNESFTSVLTLFKNPILGVLVGAVFTAIIQSSSASVGVLQALTTTGGISYAAAVPIIMGQNIGTCVSAMISSIGATKNGKRAAIIHLSFNVIATLILLPLYYIIIALVEIPIVNSAANPIGIALVHTGFKIAALLILMPASNLLVKISYKLVPDTEDKNEIQLLDERLLPTPSVAISRCRTVACSMAATSVNALKNSIKCISAFDQKTAESVRADEAQVDTYEDKLGTYLVSISSQSLSEADSVEVNRLLHMIGDFERISDHAVNIIESAEEMKDKKVSFSGQALHELNVMSEAVAEILDMSLKAFCDNDLITAARIEPLEEVVDKLKDFIKSQHIQRLTRQECTIELGFILSDILTNLERVSDHCSNIGCCVIEIAHNSMDVHQYLHDLKSGDHFNFDASYEYYKNKYTI